MSPASATQITDTNRAGDYRLAGRIFHAGYGCPTWVPEASELGCSATAWLIDTGTVRGVDVSDLVVVSVSWRPSEASSASSAPSSLVALVDERATPEQLGALEDVFRGRLGGPLSCFALLAGTWIGTYQVPIDHTSEGGVCTFSVPNRLDMAIAVPGPGLPRGYTPGGDTAAPIDWALAWVGRGMSVAVTIPEQSWAFEAQDCQAFFAWFATRSPVARHREPPARSAGREEAPVWSWWTSSPSPRDC